MDQKFFDETGLRDAGGLSCFYCNEDLVVGAPYIEWHGETDIQLHPGCAVEFCIRLMRDVHEYECRHVKGELLGPPGVAARSR